MAPWVAIPLLSLTHLLAKPAYQLVSPTATRFLQAWDSKASKRVYPLGSGSPHSYELAAK